MILEMALDARAKIGESPTWVAAERALFWIDVKAPALHRFSPEQKTNVTWLLPSDIGGFAMFEDGAALVALRDGIFRLDLQRGTLDQLAAPPFDPALFRFNEGACDAHGRFWVGVMFDPLAGDPPPQAGSLHSFTLKEGLRPEPDDAELHNGMAWSADGQTFFLSHSRRREIVAFDYRLEDGRLSKRRVFATIPEGEGIPDGAAVDTEGGYWCALHGGARLRRFRADGSFDRDLTLPVSRPTMCAFAGDQKRTLYVTSASDQMSAAEKQREFTAGGIFRLVPGEAGIGRPFVVR